MPNVKLHPEDYPAFRATYDFAIRAGWNAAGLWYNEVLAGPGGCSYTLFVPPGTSPEQVAAAKTELYGTHDVVDITCLEVPAAELRPDPRLAPSNTDLEKIAKIRAIVGAQAFDMVDGVALDLFSASAIIKVYDAIGNAQRAKFAALAVDRMAAVAFKLLDPTRRRTP